MTSAIRDTFARPTDEHVIVADGHGIVLRVSKDQLEIRDGMCGETRNRSLSRIERKIKRILVVCNTGHVTLEAMAWMADVGIDWSVVAPTGKLLATSAVSPSDMKLRRAQALIASAPQGLALTKDILSMKFASHGKVIPGWDTGSWIRRLNECPTIDDCRNIEGQEAASYFASWTEIEVLFDSDRVPAYWTRFDARTSIIGAHGPKNATSPVNALLNYGYAVLEAETTIGCHAFGLDPALGIFHYDQKHRQSLACDLMEPLRAMVDDYVLHLVHHRVFTRDDFHGEKDGSVRVLRPLTHDLSELQWRFRTALGPVIERTRDAILATVTGQKGSAATRYTQTNRKAAAAEVTDRKKGGRHARTPGQSA